MLGDEILNFLTPFKIPGITVKVASGKYKLGLSNPIFEIILSSFFSEDSIIKIQL